MKKIYLPFLLLLFLQPGYSQTFFTIGTNGGAGTYAASTNIYGPFTTNTTVSWNRHAYLYPASLLTGMSSNSTIDSLLFPRVSISGLYGMLAGTVTCKIYLKNTSSTDFGATPLDWSAESSIATLVYNNDPTAEISNTGGFKKFILSAPFVYTGTNLEVLIEYTQSAPATGQVVWGIDIASDIPEYIPNSVKYITGTSGAPSNLLNNSDDIHPGLAIFYTSNNPIDAKVSTIIDPGSISCYNSPQNFSVILTNAGSTNIAAGTASVTLQISGSNSYTATLNNSGSIAPGDFESIDFTGISLNNAGSNEDTAFVVLAGDPVTQNDTASSQTFTAETITTFPTVEDVEGSLPVVPYASQIAMNPAWFIQTGDYTNTDQTNPLVPHSGSNFFLFDAYNNLSGTTSRLYSNCLTLTAGSLNSVEFYMSHDDLVFSTYLDSMYLSVSTDKGVTWTRLQGFQRYDAAFTTPDWKKESVDLSAYAGLTIQIGFEGVSDFGNSFGLDDITVISASVTPVTLINFNAARNRSENSITWSTSQELNSRYFAVERSADGVYFFKIGQVAAAGNSNTQRTYQFVDPSPSKGINYYRLMIVDIDNAIKYSVVKNVKNFGLVRFVVYPNPVKEKLLLDIDVEKTGKGELNITDINGRNIYESDITLLKGVNTIPVDVARFSKGTYFIKIQTNDESFMKKFSKQ